MNDFEKERLERARQIFLDYQGNRFYMDHDGTGAEYESYHVSKETEEAWAKEYIDHFLETRMHGKEALRNYSGGTGMLKKEKQEDEWEKCLYYPLRSEHLDDVTILYMLEDSYRMAEKAAKRNRFFKEEKDAYIQELNIFLKEVQKRVENGTVSRAEDYIVQEFSDSVYTEDYLNRLKKKWEGLR